MEEEQFCRRLIDEVSSKGFLCSPCHLERKAKQKQENARKEIACNLNSTGKKYCIAFTYKTV